MMSGGDSLPAMGRRPEQREIQGAAVLFGKAVVTRMSGGFAQATPLEAMATTSTEYVTIG
jgi:hypothetical protein